MIDTEAPVSSCPDTFTPANETLICGRLCGLAIAAALNGFPIGCVVVVVTCCSNYPRVVLSDNGGAGDHISRSKSN